MNGKKKYVAIALVLLVGIGSFVFASPEDEEKGSRKEDSTVEQSGTKEPVKEETTDKEVEDNQPITNPVINTRPIVVDNSYANALAAVLELEKVLTDEQADTATELVDRVTNQNQKDSLSTRVENALNAISATELVEELEDMVSNATEKSNLVSALAFRDESATPAVEKIAGTELEEIKEELAKRIEDLKEILEDNEAPIIEAETIEKEVVNEGHYNKDVTVKVSDDATIVLVTKDGSDYDVKEKYTENGTYTVLAVDEAFNEATLTFTIDKIKPLIKGVEDGAYYNNSVTPIIEEENIQNVVVMKDGNKYTKYNVGDALTIDGTYKMRMTDKAGNKFDYITFVIDTVASTVENITYTPEVLTNGLVKVTITLNEEIKEVTNWTLTDDKKGIYREFDTNVTDFVTVYDLAGNETKVDYAVTNIDKVLPTISVDYKEGKTWILGDDNITENLRFVIEKDGKVIDDFYGVDRGVGKSFTIQWHAANHGEGEYTVTVYDEAGNSATTTAIVDVTAPEYATLRMLGGNAVKENGVQTWYVRADQNINVYMTFKEKLAVNAKVKVNGEELPTTYVKEVDGNYMYMATYPVTKSSKQGAVSIEVYGYADKLGNVGKTLTNEDITTPGQKNVVIDTIAPEYATLRMLGGKAIKENGVQTWYVKSGEEIKIYMTFKEKLAVNAKVKVNGEELPTTYVKELNGTYMYQATYPVTENSKQGAVSIEVYGYADKAGNVGKTLTNEDITTPGQKNVVIDTIAPEYATLRMLGGKAIKENGVQTWYVKSGEEIKIYMTFKEKLAVNAKVKVNGEELPTTYVKEVDGTYMYMAKYPVTESSKQGAVSIEVYGYADKLGNVGKTLTNEDITTPGQKNVVIDTVAPEYATLRMLGGKAIKENGVQTWYVKSGEEIKIYMTFKEKLAVNAKVKVNGEELPTTYVKEVDGTYMYMATYPVTENSKRGAVSIEVYGYADKLGNVGKTLTNEDITTPGQKNVVIDTIAPEYATLRMLGGKSIKENGVQTWYVRADQDINIYMTFKEKLAVNAKVKVNGEELPTTYVKEVDGTYMYMATYRVTENSKQGAVSIEVYGYADKVGNVGKTLTNEDITTPGQKNVSIDTIAPEIVFEQDTYYVEKNGTFDHVKLTAKVIDNIDGESTLTPYKMDFVSIRNIDSLNKENVDEFDSSKEGTFKVYYKTFDKVGNEATKILNVVVQDTRTFELLSKSANTQDNYKTMIGVIVTNKEIKEAPAGWSFSINNPTVITKKYINNTDVNGEDVEIYDLYGNKLVVNMVITDINELVSAPSVVLKEDTTLEETVTVEANQEKVIDLNGKTLTVDNSNTGSNARLFQNKGKLTIKNGKIDQPVETALGIIDNLGGEVILDNVEILDKGSRNASTVRNFGGKVTILNSKIVAEGTAGYVTSGSKKSYIYGNAAVYSTGDLVIKNSTIEGNNDGQYAVYIEKGTALIENVTIDHLRGGISIYGGNVTLNNVNVIMPTTGRSSYYAIYAAVNTTYPSDAIITINGGSYAGTRSSIYASNSTTDKKLTMNINSGTFIGYGYKSNPYIQFAEGSTPEGNYNINIKGGTFKDVTLNEKYIVDGYKQVGDNVVPE